MPLAVSLWSVLSDRLHLVGINATIYNIDYGKDPENKTRLRLERVIFRVSLLFLMALTPTRFDEIRVQTTG